MESSEIYSRLNELFRNIFDNDEIVVSPRTDGYRRGRLGFQYEHSVAE